MKRQPTSVLRPPSRHSGLVWRIGFFAAAILIAQLAQAQSAARSTEPAPTQELATAPALALKDAIDEAYLQSPQIQNAKSKATEASWKKVESYAGFLPSINFGANYLFDKQFQVVQVSLAPGQSILFPEIGPTTIYSLNADLPLFDGFANYRRLDAAKDFASAAQDDSDWTKFQVSRQVMLQFYRALAAKTLKEVAEQNLRVLEDHQKDVTQFRKAGVSTNYDVLRVDVQVNEARSELMKSTDDVELTRTELATTIGRDDDPRELGGELPVLKKELVDVAGLNSLEDRKDLISMQKRTKGMESLASASAKYLVPHLDFAASYQLYNNSTNDPFDSEATRHAYSVGLTLNWNIFDGMVSISRARETAEQKYQTEKSLRAAHLKAKQDLAVYKRKFVYYCDFYRARLSDIGKSKESVRLAKEGRRAGIRTNTDLLDAEADLFRAQAGAVNAQIGAIEALVNLELTTGRRLYEFQ